MKRLIDYKSRFRILKGGKVSLVIGALVGSVTLSFAAPSGGTVTSGTANISQVGTTTNINQTTSKASINWQNFSIDTNETVNFNQPDINSITLNRVVGNESSLINGALNANGQVWLLNSNGVLFGKNASINTAGLLATTSQLSDADFNVGNYNFTDATANAVINQGTIEVSDGGYVVLASNEVRNEGTIKAVKGNVHLIGADSYTLDLNGNSLVKLTVDKGVLDALVENSGTILSDGGEIYLTTNAVNELLKGVVNNTGIIEANSIDDLSGKIEIFAHGGEAQIGGTITAIGTNEQDGGFIETSGKDFKLLDNYSISTLSENGKTGTWLIDPTDISIVNGGANGIGGSEMDADDVQIALASNNLVLTADEDIYIQEELTISQNTLTLNAGKYLSPEAAVNVTGTGVLVVNVGQSYTTAEIKNGDYNEDVVSAGGFIYNDDDDDVLAGALNIASTANYSYKMGSDGTVNTLTNILNNGKIRIGNGWYNSVSTQGTLEQPWYYDNVSTGRDGWYKLTYDTYGLDQAVGIGGDGTSPWNLNGDIVHTDTDDNSYAFLSNLMTNITVDTSGMDNGTGVVSSTVTYTTPNNGDFELTNSYSLLDATSYIKTTTSLKNVSGSDATNARIWIGTRDDYVAESDDNYKTKGNITSNGFEAITDASTEAKAIIITENTFASGEGAAVLFYSTSENTNTIIEDCCNFSNTINLNPTDSVMNLDTSGAEDGSYGIFLSLGSLANQESKSLDWYYAAGPVSALNEVVTQVGTSSGVTAPVAPAQNDDVTNVIAPIVNETITELALPKAIIPELEAIKIQTPEMKQTNTNLAKNLGLENGNIQIVSKPNTRETADKVVTLADIKIAMKEDNTSTNAQGVQEDVRVPLSKNSIVELVNGGVNLPDGVDQQFFVVEDES